jgi:uncharacterized protein YpmS
MNKKIKIYKNNIEYVNAQYLVDKYNLPDHVLRNLVRYGEIEVEKLNNKTSLYPKVETIKLLKEKGY